MADPTPTPLTDAEREALLCDVGCVGEHETTCAVLGEYDVLLSSSVLMTRVEHIVAARVAAACADERERLKATGFDDELTELASFVWVETRHKPTQLAVIALRGDLRALAQPARDGADQ